MTTMQIIKLRILLEDCEKKDLDFYWKELQQEAYENLDELLDVYERHVICVYDADVWVVDDRLFHPPAMHITHGLSGQCGEFQPAVWSGKAYQSVDLSPVQLSYEDNTFTIAPQGGKGEQ